MTVCYVSDHWAQYVCLSGSAPPPPPPTHTNTNKHSLSQERLQQEYDHLFLRAVLHVLRNKRRDPPGRNTIGRMPASWESKVNLSNPIF